MQLNITNVNTSDYGDYRCISKNEVGITKGTVKLMGKIVGPEKGTVSKFLS